jgi:hypothetical protein
MINSHRPFSNVRSTLSPTKDQRTYTSDFPPNYPNHPSPTSRSQSNLLPQWSRNINKTQWHYRNNEKLYRKQPILKSSFKFPILLLSDNFPNPCPFSSFHALISLPLACLKSSCSVFSSLSERSREVEKPLQSLPPEAESPTTK